MSESDSKTTTENAKIGIFISLLLIMIILAIGEILRELIKRWSTDNFPEFWNRGILEFISVTEMCTAMYEINIGKWITQAFDFTHF